MIDKTFATVAEALADVLDGATVMVGGFGGAGMPNELIDGLIAQSARDLTIVGMGPALTADAEDFDLINAGKQPVTLLPGGSYFHSADSFAMMRAGHLDIAVLGAFQVAANGDLANWHTGDEDDIPAVGGAMDLAVGAKQTWVMMEHLTRLGESKLVERCTYPLTG